MKKKQINTRDKFLLEEMTWEEAALRFTLTNVAVLPVGSIEQHGPHLPLSTDAFDAYWLAREVIKRVSSPKPIVLPPVNYGVSYHHLAFPGTVSLSPATLAEITYEIGCSLIRYGIKKILIINGHGGNKAALHCGAQKLAYEKKIRVFIDSGEIMSNEEESEVLETPGDVHSGEYETSTSLFNREHLVIRNKIKKPTIKFPNDYLKFHAKNYMPWTYTTEEITDTGVMGNPTKASKIKGKKLWEIRISHLVKFIEQIK